MKYLLIPSLFFFFLLTTVKSFAQNGTLVADDKNLVTTYEDKTVKNEIGFDMFYFLNLFRAHLEGQTASIFTISYNRELSDKHSLRITLGTGYSNYSSTVDSSPTTKSFLIDEVLRAGIAWKTQTYKRWQFYGGVDIEFQYTYSKLQELGIVKNSVTDNINRSLMLGPGPFIGIVAYLNPRVSLSLETNMNILYSESESKVSNPFQPELTSDIKTTGMVTNFTPAGNIFLNIKF